MDYFLRSKVVFKTTVSELTTVQYAINIFKAKKVNHDLFSVQGMVYSSHNIIRLFGILLLLEK